MNSQDNLSALASGYRLQDYEIVSVLGVGGFGITYLANDTRLGLPVAIKEYLPATLAVRTPDNTVSPKSTADVAGYRWGLDRFLKEAQTLARFRHPNIVRVLRFFEANSTAYTVMEYEQGQSLTEFLTAHPEPLREPALLKILLPLLDGLRQVHKAGYLHRDIKPGNIYLRHDDSPVLLDFGSARLALGTHTQNLTAVFTPGYAPFEQYFHEGKQGPWTDIYALGAVMYQAVTGKLPPDAASRVKNDALVPAAILGKGRCRSEFLKAIDQALVMNEAQRPPDIDSWLKLFTTPTGTHPGSRTAQVTDVATTVVLPRPDAPAACWPPARKAPASRAARRPSRRRGILKPLLTVLMVVLVVNSVLRHIGKTRPAQAAPAPVRDAPAAPISVPVATPADAIAPVPARRVSATETPLTKTQRKIMRKIKRRFEQADVDGNGYLSRAELAAAFPRLAPYFDRIDRNHDGRVSRAELARAIEILRRQDQRRRKWRARTDQ